MKLAYVLGRRWAEAVGSVEMMERRSKAYKQSLSVPDLFILLSLLVLSDSLLLIGVLTVVVLLQ